MANQVNISVSQLGSAIHSLIEYNIDENMEALSENITEAAEHAAAELRQTSATKDARRGPSSISEDVGAYRSAWKAYTERSGRDKVVATVAQSKMPSLTHLLEFGHEYWYFGVHVGGRIPGNKAIATAFDNAAPIAQGGSR